ncbi:hypothetical protein [Candidatus Poriferisocius sp.]|uniref:hypothetical protein n=1 Tax=Candidatus Poriferisocius sp. TaxID=3101276 RepID=UPI003B02660D
MSDAVAFLLILPVVVLGVAVLDAAGTLGSAEYRTSVFTETAAVYAADTLADSSAVGAEPSARARWGEVAATVEQSALAATAGVCNQTDASFDISLISQPRAPNSPGDSPSVAVVVICPVEMWDSVRINRLVAVAVEPVE